MKWDHVMNELDRHREQRRALVKRLDTITKELKSVKREANKIQGK